MLLLPKTDQDLFGEVFYKTLDLSKISETTVVYFNLKTVFSISPSFLYFTLYLGMAASTVCRRQHLYDTILPFSAWHKWDKYAAPEPADMMDFCFQGPKKESMFLFVSQQGSQKESDADEIEGHLACNESTAWLYTCTLKKVYASFLNTFVNLWKCYQRHLKKD